MAHPAFAIRLAQLSRVGDPVDLVLLVGELTERDPVQEAWAERASPVDGRLAI